MKNIQEAKTHLSRLVEQAAAGGERHAAPPEMTTPVYFSSKR